MDLCVGFCSSPQDKSIPQRTQPLTKVSSRLLMWAVSVAQWQEEIKLFLEGTEMGGTRFSFSVCPSLRSGLSFYLETDGDFFSHQILFHCSCLAQSVWFSVLSAISKDKQTVVSFQTFCSGKQSRTIISYCIRDLELLHLLLSL